MQAWYYSKNGEQRGPVSLEELRRLMRGSDLNLQSDLAWTEGMANWLPLGMVPALLASESTVAAAPESFNPYAAPTTSPDNLLAPRSGCSLQEIEPGSVPLEVMNCIKRSIELTKRHFGTLLGIGAVYLVIVAVLGGLEGFITQSLTGVPSNSGQIAFHPLLIPIKLISGIISMVLAAGLARVSLNVCSGEKAKIEDLFSQTRKLGALFGSAILFYIIVFVGLIALVVPGIYMAIRCGFFMNAIVDRNLGPIEALKYSYRLTANNTLSLFGLGIMSLLVILAGVLALVVGLLFAIPVVTLVVPLAYRFLQFGPNVLRDQ